MQLDTVTRNEEFSEYFYTLNPLNFTAEDFLYLGESHWYGLSCQGLNNIPPDDLWPNVENLLIAIDEIQNRLADNVSFNSIYRNPDYNACVEGVSNSQHLVFNALDFSVAGGNTNEWHAVASQVRSDGYFSGGIGKYNSFIHIDVRGHNVDWDKT